jgi:hypothetical protein
MLENDDFVAISDEQGAEIVGGRGAIPFVLWYLWNNAGHLVAGVREGYAAGGSPHA